MGQKYNVDNDGVVSLIKHSTDHEGQRLVGLKSRGSVSSRIPVISDDILLDIRGTGWDSLAFGYAGGIKLAASEAWDNDKHGSHISFRTVASGTTEDIERMRLTNDGRLGLGINQAAPYFASIHLLTTEHEDGSGRQAIVNEYVHDSSTAAPEFIVVKSRGTLLARSGILNSDNIGRFSGAGWDGVGIAGSASIGFKAEQDFTATAHGTAITFQVTPLDSIVDDEVMRIDSLGRLGLGISPTYRVHVDSPSSIAATNAASFSYGGVDKATLTLAATTGDPTFTLSHNSGKQAIINPGAASRFDSGIISHVSLGMTTTGDSLIYASTTGADQDHATSGLGIFEGIIGPVNIFTIRGFSSAYEARPLFKPWPAAINNSTEMDSVGKLLINANQATDISMAAAGGSVVIGQRTVVPSAVLSLISSDQGFLPPAMLAASRTSIGSPAEGLLVYTNDAGVKRLYCYNGSVWEAVGTGTVGAPPTEHRQKWTAAGGSEQFLTEAAYVKNGINLKVFVNGNLQDPTSNYTEDDTTHFTIPAGLIGGETVEAIWTVWPS